MVRHRRFCLDWSVFSALILLTTCIFGISSLASGQSTTSNTRPASPATSSFAGAAGAGDSQVVPTTGHAAYFAASPSSGQRSNRVQASGQYSSSYAGAASQTTSARSGVKSSGGKLRQDGQSPSYSLGLSFSGLGNGFPGYTVSAPNPDTNIAVGDTEVVQWVNTSYADFNKSTGAIIPVNGLNFTPGNTIWQDLMPGSACATNNDGSPIVEWDTAAHRWLMTQNVFVAPYAVCVAISQTATFSDNLWYAYEFSVPGNGWPDYPKWGAWPTGYFQAMNNLGPNGSGFVGAQVCGYDRTKMINGDSTAEQICFQLTGTDSSLLPADLDSPSTLPPAAQDEFFIGSVGANDDNSHLSVYSMHINDWATGNATITGGGNSQLIPISTFTPACAGSYSGNCVPQESVPNLLQSLGDRLMYRFAYYSDNGTFDPITATQLSVFQQGTLAPDTNWRWMGSVAGDRANDILLGYSVSSTSMFPSIAIAGRMGTDLAGSLESELTVLAGTGSQTASPWGGYSAMRVDPADNCTFWYSTEYYQSNASADWSTQIASVTFPSCSAPPAPRQHWYVNLDVAAAAGQNGIQWMELSNTIASQTAVTSSQNPSQLGNPVTFTATVTGSMGTPTGTVTFLDNGNSISDCPGPVMLVNGAGTCITSSLTLGQHSIEATYSGDSTYSSSSGTLTQAVKLMSTTTVTAAPSPSDVNQTVTLTAVVSGSGGIPTGTVTFTYNSGTTIPECPSAVTLDSGAATCVTQSLPLGTDTVSVSYSGDSTYLPGGGMVSQQVRITPTTTVLISAPNPSDVNQAVVFTATVTPQYSGPTKPGGTVTFTQGTTTLCNQVPLASDGTAQCSYVFLAPGSPLNVTATYSGDNNFVGSPSPPLAQTVNKTQTTTVLVSAPNPSFVNQAVVFTATVTPQYSGQTIPSGTVTFTQGTATLCQVQLAPNGTAQCSYVFLAPGSPLNVTATYSGDNNFVGSPSQPLAQTVNKTPTTTVLVSAPNPSFVNQAVVFTATVTPQYSGQTIPSGTVTFTQGTATLCQVQLAPNGTAQCSYVFLAPGSPLNVTATYSGDNNFVGSPSQPLAQTVNATPTTTVLVSAPNPSDVNQTVVFTATVTPLYSGQTIPTGKVTFTQGTNTLCNQVTLLPNGTAQCQYIFTAPTPSGSPLSITATYSGDNNFVGSPSQPLAQTVNKSPTTTALVSAPNPSDVNQNVRFTATVTPMFPGSVIPTGTVTFAQGMTTLCSQVPLASNGTAQCSYIFAAPSPSGSPLAITAAYSGDNNFQNSNGTATQTVNQTPTTVRLVVSPSPSSVSTEPVTFTATIFPKFPGTTLPTGTVSFSGNGLSQLSCQLANGNTQCSVTVTSLPSGADQITATYSGDTNFTGNSASTTQTVEDFSLTPSPASSTPIIVMQTLTNASNLFTQLGQTTSGGTPMSVSATPLYGFGDGLNVACSVTPAPQNSNFCSLSSSALGFGSSNTVAVAINTCPSSGSSCASVGVYTVTVTATDAVVGTLMHSATFTVSVINYATPPVSFLQGIGGSGMTTVMFAGATGVTLNSLQCAKVIGSGLNTAGENQTIDPPGVAPAMVGLGCTFSPASLQLANPATSMSSTQLTVSGIQNTAMLRRSNGILMAIWLAMPAFVLIGPLRHRKFSRKTILQSLLLLLTLIALMQGVGCGGGFTATSSSTGSAGQGALLGSYSVLVEGTGSDGATYYAVVPVNVGH